MRGLRSFLLLLVVAAWRSAGTCTSSNRSASRRRRRQEGQGLHRRGRQDRGVTVKSESGERTTVQKNGTDWQIVAAGGGAKPTAPRCPGITTNLASLEIQRVIDENPADVGEYGLDEPRVEVAFKSAGKEQQAADRPQDADRQRPLRQARRSEARRS